MVTRFASASRVVRKTGDRGSSAGGHEPVHGRRLLGNRDEVADLAGSIEQRPSLPSMPRHRRSRRPTGPGSPPCTQPCSQSGRHHRLESPSPSPSGWQQVSTNSIDLSTTATADCSRPAATSSNAPTAPTKRPLRSRQRRRRSVIRSKQNASTEGHRKPPSGAERAKPAPPVRTAGQLGRSVEAGPRTRPQAGTRRCSSAPNRCGHGGRLAVTRGVCREGAGGCGRVGHGPGRKADRRRCVRCRGCGRSPSGANVASRPS